MGSQQNDIQENISSKSTLATWLLTPAILGGMALFGFQTYSLLTGKKFTDFDFKIGTLWSTEEAAPVSRETEGSSNLASPTLRELIAEPLEIMATEDAAIPQVRRKTVLLTEENHTDDIVKSEQVKELFSSETITVNSISASFGNKQIQKYLERMQNDYLIDPALVPRHGSWYVGISFAPSVCYRNFGYNASNVPGIMRDGNTEYTFGLTKNERNATDKTIILYTIGLDFGKRISSKLSLFSGLHYAQYGEQLHVCAADDCDPNFAMSSFMGNKPQYERSVGESQGSLPYTNKYSFLEIPLGASYAVKEYSKSKISINTAVLIQKLDHVNALVYDFDTDYYYWMNSNEDIFRKYGLGASIGVSFSQYVGERLEVYATPQFKYNLHSTFNEPYPITQNQYTGGIQVGFKQQLF